MTDRTSTSFLSIVAGIAAFFAILAAAASLGARLTCEARRGEARRTVRDDAGSKGHPGG
jgi:hypothetical protein